MKRPSIQPAPHHYDLCLILEGTYPYQIGGIASWVHDLLAGLPEMRIALVRIAPQVQERTRAFELPKQVRHFQEITNPDDWQALDQWASEATNQLPQASIYHVVGAGLAGMLGLQAQARFAKPLILSEHASYLHELSLGLPQLESGLRVPQPSSEQRQQILATFEDLACTLYQRADHVIALDAQTQQRQIHKGLSKQRSRVIPNGVSRSSLDAIQANRTPSTHITTPRRVLYVGRIHPIKGTDIFVRAALKLSQSIPDLQFDIIGPWDCDSDYIHACKKLGAPLGENLRFLGPKARFDWGNPPPELLIVPSRSEAQPLVILEAWLLGVPVIVSDVGGCRAMCEHKGRQGALVLPQGSVNAITEAARTLLSNPTLANTLRRNGVRLYRAHFSLEAMQQAYRELYQQHSNSLHRRARQCA